MTLYGHNSKFLPHSMIDYKIATISSKIKFLIVNITNHVSLKVL